MVEGDCIESHSKPSSWGYGRIKFRGSARPHHRVIYAEHHGLDIDGPEMAGMEVDHLCFNRLCINIEHLELVPKEENLRRAHAAGRVPSRKGRKLGPNLTPYAVLWIRSHSKEGRTQSELAEMFGVSPITVSRIIRRKTWADV